MKTMTGVHFVAVLVWLRLRDKSDDKVGDSKGVKIMISKETMKCIKETLAWVKLCVEGYKNINGGYAEVKKMKVKRLGQNLYSVKGIFVFGEQDCGDGCSTQYTETFEGIKVKEDAGKFEVVR